LWGRVGEVFLGVAARREGYLFFLVGTLVSRDFLGFENLEFEKKERECVCV